MKISHYREIIGTRENPIRGTILGQSKSHYRENIGTRKSHHTGQILGHENPIIGENWDM